MIEGDEKSRRTHREKSISTSVCDVSTHRWCKRCPPCGQGLTAFACERGADVECSTFTRIGDIFSLMALSIVRTRWTANMKPGMLIREKSEQSLLMESGNMIGSFKTRWLPVLNSDRRLWRPVVVVEFESESGPLRCNALVDTGATHSIFPLSWAKEVGVSLGRPSTTIVAGKGSVLAFREPVEMVIRKPGSLNEHWKWQADVLFADLRTEYHGVLGFFGFLEFFHFHFRSSEGRFTLEENSLFRGTVISND